MNLRVLELFFRFRRGFRKFETIYFSHVKPICKRGHGGHQSQPNVCSDICEGCRDRCQIEANCYSHRLIAQAQAIKYGYSGQPITRMRANECSQLTVFDQAGFRSFSSPPSNIHQPQDHPRSSYLSESGEHFRRSVFLCAVNISPRCVSLIAVQ